MEENTQEYADCIKCKHFVSRVEGSLTDRTMCERPKREVRVICNEDMLSTKGIGCPKFEERGWFE